MALASSITRQCYLSFLPADFFFLGCSVLGWLSPPDNPTNFRSFCVIVGGGGGASSGSSGGSHLSGLRLNAQEMGQYLLSGSSSSPVTEPTTAETQIYCNVLEDRL